MPVGVDGPMAIVGDMSALAVDAASGALWRRRIAATAIDYAIVAGYVCVLLAIGLLLLAAGWLPGVSGSGGRLGAQVVTSAVLSAPVTLWLASQEARRGATIGKRRLGLTVVTRRGGRPGWWRSLGRAVLKVFLPWELAHTAIWDLALRPDGGDVLDMAMLAAVYAIVIGYLVSLWVGAGRTPYDRLTGTTVVRTVAVVPQA
jgi:uncharacterized RDD family membrane protein YckC